MGHPNVELRWEGLIYLTDPAPIKGAMNSIPIKKIAKNRCIFSRFYAIMYSNKTEDPSVQAAELEYNFNQFSPNP